MNEQDPYYAHLQAEVRNARIARDLALAQWIEESLERIGRTAARIVRAFRPERLRA